MKVVPRLTSGCLSASASSSFCLSSSSFLLSSSISAARSTFTSSSRVEGSVLAVVSGACVFRYKHQVLLCTREALFHTRERWNGPGSICSIVWSVSTTTIGGFPFLLVPPSKHATL